MSRASAGVSKEDIFRNNVYMVIRVKIAYDARCARTKLRNRGNSTQFDVGGSSIESQSVLALKRILVLARQRAGHSREILPLSLHFV